MAKELPYFKFEPGQWDNGKIQLCKFEEQGIYINLCSLYWQRLGKLPYKLALQKICGGNATALESLCREEIIAVIDGDICIDFLNEQLSEFHNASNTNSKNALSGWEKRRKNAAAMRPHSDPNAIREDKIREDVEENREEDKKVLNGNGAASAAHTKLTVDERKKILMQKIAEFLSEYGKEMCREFFDYWSEISEGGRKMRFEKEKVFDVARRLRTWKKNDYGNKSKPQIDPHTRNQIGLMEGFRDHYGDVLGGGKI